MALEKLPGNGDASAEVWRIDGIRDHAAFFRNLPWLLPPGSVLALEGGMFPNDLRALLTKHEVPASFTLASGTWWPRRRTHHVPATEAVLRDLADRTEHCAAPEVCAHLHVYREGEVLLEWFDAFTEALYISKTIPEGRLLAFCSALGVGHTTVKGVLPRQQLPEAKEPSEAP